jgi:hypothetical protein
MHLTAQRWLPLTQPARQQFGALKDRCCICCPPVRRVERQQGAADSALLRSASSRWDGIRYVSRQMNKGFAYAIFAAGFAR